MRSPVCEVSGRPSLLSTLTWLPAVALLTAIPALEGFGRVLELLAVVLQLPVYCLGAGAILDSRFGGRHRPAAV